MKIFQFSYIYFSVNVFKVIKKIKLVPCTCSRRARLLATTYIFARVRIIGTLVPFCVIGTSKEFPITQKTVIHFCTTVFFIYLQNCTLNFFYFLSFILQEITSSYLSLTITFWLSPRPISNSQLHVLLRFHLCPIYLVVFKGSYWINSRDILS